MVCGVCAITAMGALGGLPSIARADAEQDQERQIGQQVYQQLVGQKQILQTSPYYPVLRSVGAKINAAAQPHWWPMNFVLVGGSQVNAFSTPGGWVYVNEALCKQAENEDELANVLGHETGHIVLGHVMNRIKQAETANVVGSLLGLVIRNPMTQNVISLAGNYAFLNFDRSQEYQADHEGVILAGKAQYNPNGMVWFFQKLQKLYGDSGFEQFTQDHPSTPDRITRIEAFFKSDPSQFAHWSTSKPTTAGLSTSSGSDAKLILTPTP